MNINNVLKIPIDSVNVSPHWIYAQFRKSGDRVIIVKCWFELRLVLFMNRIEFSVSYWVLTLMLFIQILSSLVILSRVFSLSHFYVYKAHKTVKEKPTQRLFFILHTQTFSFSLCSQTSWTHENRVLNPKPRTNHKIIWMCELDS